MPPALIRHGRNSSLPWCHCAGLLAGLIRSLHASVLALQQGVRLDHTGCGEFEVLLRNTRAMRAINAVIRFPAVLRAMARDWMTANTAPNYLSVCAIFKNEARFLNDWITFHRGVGVSHFFLYDNESTDNPLSELDRWIQEGIVTVVNWPGRGQQRHAYMHCIRKNWKTTRWLAFLDIDEFLFSPDQVAICPILKNYENRSGVLVYWQVFGSSGHNKRPNCSVIDAYTMRENVTRIPSGKSIVNPRFVRRVPNSHNFALWKGETTDTDGTALPYDYFFHPNFEKTAKLDVLRINHYWSRSLEDLSEKVLRGDAFFAHKDRILEDHLAEERLLNETEDLAIQPIWKSIKSGNKATW